MLAGSTRAARPASSFASSSLGATASATGLKRAAASSAWRTVHHCQPRQPANTRIAATIAPATYQRLSSHHAFSSAMRSCSSKSYDPAM